MQQAVKAINADPSLSQEEKSRRIHELFVARAAAPKSLQAEESVKPCSHYQRNCDIHTPCCSKWYSCRLCHDEAETDHTLVRGSTMMMRCRKCHVIQPVAKACSTETCDWKTTLYFCEPCRLWEDNPNKQIYHCDGCRICRVGKREEYWHCGRCNLCLPKSIKQESHHCIENAADDACICGEHMHSSTKSVCVLPCGHTLHAQCQQNMLRSGNYNCPKCRKAIIRDRLQERLLEIEIRLNPMPPEHRKKVEILCNDCQKKAVKKFHWMGIKCDGCQSFNTAILRSVPCDPSELDDDEPPLTTEEAASLVRQITREQNGNSDLNGSENESEEADEHESNDEEDEDGHAESDDLDLD